MNDLGFDGQILNTFPGSFDGLILDDGLFDFLGNVFDLGFDSVVVGDGPFDGDSLGVDDLFVFNNFSLEGDSLDSLNSIVFDVFLLEWDVLDSAFNWNLFGNHFLMATSYN